MALPQEVRAFPASVTRPLSSSASSAARQRLSIVLVNYRQWDATHALVRQLLAAPTLRRGEAEVMIIDNSSSHHPALSKLRRTAHVSILRWKKNRGFARAVNEGCRLGRGDWFLLLNPDMSLPEDFVERVLESAERLDRLDPRAGIIGFHLRNSDGSQQLSTGPIPTLTSTLARLALPRRARKYQVVSTTDPCQVPWATGCCLLVRRDCLKDLGGFDEKFFLYYEDVDLCLRARQRGWGVWYDPSLAAVHHHPLHGRAHPAALRCVTRHSLLVFARKHWPRWQAALLAGLVQVEGWMRGRLSRWRGDHREARVFEQMAALARAFRAGAHDESRARLERIIRRLDVRVGI